MAWIETVSNDLWQDDLADILPMVSDGKSGRVDLMIQIHSLNPRGMTVHHQIADGLGVEVEDWIKDG